MTVQETRHQIEMIEVDDRDPMAVACAFERYEHALWTVLDTLERGQAGPDVAVVGVNRLCSDIVAALNGGKNT